MQKTRVIINRQKASAQAFHCLKVQCLGDDSIKPSTEVGGTFVVPVLSIIALRKAQPKASQTTQDTPKAVS